MMTKRFPSCRKAAVLSLLALGACDTPTGGIAPNDDGRRLAESLGLDAGTVQDHGSYWLVEGDIVLPKTQAGASGKASPAGVRPSFQYMTFNSVWTNPGSIVVDLSQIAGNPEWQAAARTAIAAWAAVPGSTIRVTEGAPGDITVRTECRNDNVLGRAGFPANGRPFPTIFFNTCWIVGGWWINPTPGARAHTAVHEMGHTLGFRHTNMIALGEGSGSAGAVHMNGTPGSEGDAASVMNGQSAGTEWAGLSFFDRVAFLARYPDQPVVTVTNSGGQPLVSWSAIAGATGYTVDQIWINQVTDENWNTSQNSSERLVANTTGTSALDTSPWTGEYFCERWVGNERIQTQTRYRVTATFPAGTTVTEVPAPIASCP